ncbi:hypothetical protein OSH39_23740 [Mycobacterium ulcerans]|uniref:Uncharacterized protein n=2 Tax=Mycobacterium ulcerans TaxID=1809 RepID=A0ABY3VDG8_MYCUL|nr:hypothetical protein [Mycobacterium ulcerans]EUA90598.1 hypothetical protein I551_2952 [Mycobacterium ulcerans str. Harvey]MEB3906103.1 hypothetical protein [Mycobacterium ulcerans]MEB3910274.1 hypothetical protein [Mycobacterium ulcerans]MEB3920509.1 hypothetical protein [Mycobacterium ulcerans]MEB3924597.1 hypothetical protein [Mycobacterium ulcerans]
MNKTAGAIKINVWINDERLAALEQAGMAQLAEEAFAGMKLLAISTTEEQKDLILQWPLTLHTGGARCHS